LRPLTIIAVTVVPVMPACSQSVSLVPACSQSVSLATQKQDRLRDAQRWGRVCRGRRRSLAHAVDRARRGLSPCSRLHLAAGNGSPRVPNLLSLAPLPTRSVAYRAAGGESLPTTTSSALASIAGGHVGPTGGGTRRAPGFPSSPVIACAMNTASVSRLPSSSSTGARVCSELLGAGTVSRERGARAPQMPRHAQPALGGLTMTAP
jgi:hypothetical protein